ncbi:hypothetical protein RHMOL_Rhmol02G0146000 [Rhododendron molle]|uniref:Uncharacterized protein n=1 Tax=Rhododendron molle TaxID=49168 RepID=A0ACC0PRV8_RHOML|nr:hypothetical protein RHMOL_Rhmol02G0146000 [Rhododendron molle]
MPSVGFLSVFFAGEQIGEGIGRIRREAQLEAAEGSQMNLAVEIWTRREAEHQAAEGSLMNFASEIWYFVRRGGHAICLVLWVLYVGEKIGEGIGRTRREAEHQAAEGSLMNLAGEIWFSLREGKLVKELEVMPSVGFLKVLFAGEKIGEGIGRTRMEAQHEAVERSLINWLILFVGEKFGEGIGRTRSEAQHHDAEGSLMNLAVRFGILRGHIIRTSCYLLGFYRSCFREKKLVKKLVRKEGKPSIRPQSDPSRIWLEVMASVWFLWVLFAGEKIGEGIGWTRSEAQHHAAVGSLMNLACEIWRSCHLFGFYRSCLRERKLVNEVVAQEGKPSIRAQSDPSLIWQVFFMGEKIGEGIGRTRSEAKHHAAEGSLMDLAIRCSILSVEIDSFTLYGLVFVLS